MKLIKSLTALSLVFALFTLHIETGAIAFSSAYAQDPTPTPAATNAPTIDYTDQEKKVGKLNYAQIATMAGLAIVPITLVSCPGVWSAYAYAAGGAVYLLKEIMGYSRFKDASTSNQEMIASLDENSATQIEALTAAETQENTAAQALGNKASGMMIFAIGATAATVIAVLEIFPWWPGNRVCTVVDNNNKKIQPIQIRPLKEESIIQYYARMDEFNDYLFGNSYQSPKTNTGSEFDIGDELISSYIPKQQQQSFLQMVYDFSGEISELFISSANAKDEVKVNDGGTFWTQIGITTAGGVLAFITPVQQAFGKLMNLIPGRIGLFGAMTALTWTAYSQVNKAKKNAESNARVYANLRDKLSAALANDGRFAGMNGPTTGVRTGIRPGAGPRDQVNQIPEGAICVTGSLGEQRIDNACNCAKNNTCSQVSFNSVPLQNTGLPSFLGTSLGALGQGANSLFSGNTQGADAAFGTLGNNAANLRKLADNLKDKANAELKKNKAKYTVADLEKEAMNKLENDLPRIFNSLPADQRKALGDFSNFGLGGAVVSPAQLAEDKDASKKEILESVQAALAKQKAGATSAFKFDFGEDALAPSDNAETTLNQGNALSDYESNESDISDRPNESIFKIITVRYFKSAYPRFFTEEQANERQSLE